MCIAIAVVVDRDGALHTAIGDWPAPIAINMVADRFAALMLVIGSAMLAAVLVFAIGAREPPTSDRPGTNRPTWC